MDRFPNQESFLEFCLAQFHRSRGEELANAISHLLGIVFGIVALTMTVVFASLERTAIYITSCAIYGSMLIILYTASTLYHWIRSYKVKRIFQLFDHCSIYLLIAGSYTPYSLLVLQPAMAWTIFGIEWGLALLGILTECLATRRIADIISLPIFIAMGWLIVVAFPQIQSGLSSPAFWTLVSGGLAYTIGIVFFLFDRIPYMHTVWHFFVLAGSVLHWVSITFFVVRP